MTQDVSFIDGYRRGSCGCRAAAAIGSIVGPPAPGRDLSAHC
ncbi:hypothetical protein [Micromonospora arborensis]